MIGDIALRPETAQDAPFLAALFRESRPPHERLSGIHPVVAEQLMEVQQAGQAASYRGAFPRARFDVVTVAGEPVGRLVVDEGREIWSLVDLCLREAWRGRGLGTRLVVQVMAGAAAAGVPVLLHVGIANHAARRLYARLGFVAAAADDIVVAMTWTPARSPDARSAS